MRVGRGTLMGNLLRDYWMPIAAVSELDDNPIAPVRLHGEDFALFQDKRGTTASSIDTAVSARPTSPFAGLRTAVFAATL